LGEEVSPHGFERMGEKREKEIVGDWENDEKHANV